MTVYDTRLGRSRVKDCLFKLDASVLYDAFDATKRQGSLLPSTLCDRKSKDFVPRGDLPHFTKTSPYSESQKQFLLQKPVHSTPNDFNSYARSVSSRFGSFNDDATVRRNRVLLTMKFQSFFSVLQSQTFDRSRKKIRCSHGHWQCPQLPLRG